MADLSSYEEFLEKYEDTPEYDNVLYEEYFLYGFEEEDSEDSDDYQTNNQDIWDLACVSIRSPARQQQERCLLQTKEPLSQPSDDKEFIPHPNEDIQSLPQSLPHPSEVIPGLGDLELCFSKLTLHSNEDSEDSGDYQPNNPNPAVYPNKKCSLKEKISLGMQPLSGIPQPGLLGQPGPLSQPVGPPWWVHDTSKPSPLGMPAVSSPVANISYKPNLPKPTAVVPHVGDLSNLFAKLTKAGLIGSNKTEPSYTSNLPDTEKSVRVFKRGYRRQKYQCSAEV